MMSSKEAEIKQLEEQLRKSINLVSALMTLRWVGFSSRQKNNNPTLSGAYSTPSLLEDLGDF